MTERTTTDAGDSGVVTGRMAALPIENLDTDQIMPKQFLHGIDKTGLRDGLLHDLRFDPQGKARPDFVLNRADRSDVSVLVAGANFGCGSSREHAVWGLQQYGIRAVIAPSFGEIFYSNAMNNRLLLVMLPAARIAELMAAAEDPATSTVRIDVTTMTVHGADMSCPFTMSDRHRRMFLEGLDVIGLSLAHRKQIESFATAHWAAQPWLRDVAKLTRQRLDSPASVSGAAARAKPGPA